MSRLATSRCGFRNGSYCFRVNKYPPAELGALRYEPLKAASGRRALNAAATYVPNKWTIMSIASDDALFLPHRANPVRSNFREPQPTGTNAPVHFMKDVATDRFGKYVGNAKAVCFEKRLQVPQEANAALARSAGDRE